MLARSGNFAGAIEAYRAALSVAPDYLAARVNLGHALLGANRPAEAVREYEAALTRAPNDTALRAQLDETRALLARRLPVPRDQ